MCLKWEKIGGLIRCMSKGGRVRGVIETCGKIVELYGRGTCSRLRNLSYVIIHTSLSSLYPDSRNIE